MRSSGFVLCVGLAAVALAAGCAQKEVASASFAHASRDVFSAVRGARAAGPQDHYVALRGKKATPVGLGFYQTTPDVWSPFDVSIHTGFFDPGRMDAPDGVRACLEIDNIGFTVFYDVCAEYDAALGGFDLTAFSGSPIVTLPGTLFIAGEEVELRLTSDDVTLTFAGRAFGSATWLSVDSMPWPGQAAALKAAFGATSLARRTEIGFDDPTFTSAAAPGPLTAEEQAAAYANRALLHVQSAFLLLDATPDFMDAPTAVGNAGIALDDAIDAVGALPPSKLQKQAAKQLAKARQRLDRASAQVTAQDAEKALKLLGKVATAAERAVLLLVPQPLTP